MLYASSDDLANYLGVSSIDRARADAAIASVSAEIVRYTRQSFGELKDETIMIDGTGSPLLQLPGAPVANVAAITEHGVALAATEWRWSRAGMVEKLSGAWPRGFRTIEVTYTHGYEYVPEDVRAVCLRCAARSFANPVGLTSEAVGGWSASYGADSSRFGALSMADKEVLRQYMVS